MVNTARPFIRPATATRIKRLRDRGFATDRLFQDDAYQCWTVNRSAGWADSAQVEAQEVVEAGFGRLYPNGAGRPQSGNMVIHIESPFRFRTLATSAMQSGNLLVINGERLFRVDAPKPGDIDARHMDVYLTELFSTPMPVVL